MTLTLPVTIFLLLTLDLPMTLIISAIGIASFQLVTRRDPMRFLFNVGQLSIGIFLTGKFLYLFYHGTFRLPNDFAYIIPSLIIYEFINLLLVSVAIGLKNNESIGEIFVAGAKDTQVGMPLYLATGLIMHICYTTNGFWGLLLVIIPLYSINLLLQASKNADMHKENAYICPTTHLKNKRCLNEWLAKDFPGVIKNDQSICFILIDIDDFKKVNDVFGHEVGDQVLTDFGTLIKENLRDTDLIYRYGGEEFVIILPGFLEDHAQRVIDRLRAIVHNYSFADGKLHITFSAGISSPDHGLLHDINLTNNMADELIRRADKAMYSAKQMGKNQTQFYRS